MKSLPEEYLVRGRRILVCDLVNRLLNQEFLLTVVSFHAEVLVSFITTAGISEPWGGIW
jgi:hypothetical protein